jgi:hypothetical protein
VIVRGKGVKGSRCKARVGAVYDRACALIERAYSLHTSAILSKCLRKDSGSSINAARQADQGTRCTRVPNTSMTDSTLN